MPGVYISYPFCAQKCTYCNFASGVLPKEMETQYIDALRAELRGTEWLWTPETVYLGGGTPSNMAPEALAAVLAEILGREWPEATIEAAPGSIMGAKAGAWRRAGINRVSLGVQSFVARELARTGRKHTAEIVAGDVAILREAGIESINVDLIAGLPGQTEESWRESLDWVERIEAPHVSVYMFEVDEDSRLGREMRLPTIASPISMKLPSSGWLDRAWRDTRFRTSRGRVMNRGTT
jgi:oxygen-independent coproporphyrinogen-3 oxidase